MTNEEIKNGLAVCANDFCDGCSYYEFNNCYNKLKLDAQACIIEQEKEIERLKAENARLTERLGQVLLSIDTVKEMNAMCNIAEQIKQAKIDVLNELKERIKTAIDAYWNSNSGGYYLAEDVITDINNTIEEYKND